MGLKKIFKDFKDWVSGDTSEPGTPKPKPKPKEKKKKKTPRGGTGYLGQAIAGIERRNKILDDIMKE